MRHDTPQRPCMGAPSRERGHAFLAWAAVSFVSPLVCGACGHEASSFDFEPPPAACVVPPVPGPIGGGAVVGMGTPESCTEEALRTVVAAGGDVTFDCGPGPVSIVLGDEILVGEDTRIDGGGRVMLHGQGRTRILHTEAHVALTVIGLGFVQGDARSSDPGSGGAIRLGWRSTLGAFDCAFEGNRAAEDGIEGGGAIYQASGGETVIVRGTFEGNTAVSGGAIDNLLSPLTVVDSTFIGNSAPGGGGAVYTDGGSEYTADGLGGVISLCGCRFEGNESVGTGGAVYLWAYPGDLLLIHYCTFQGNATRSDGQGGSALGGALRTGNAPCQIAHSLFDGNHADVHGGAYWSRGTHPTEVVNCTFSGNTAGLAGQEGGYGGALSGFDMQVRSCTFVDNHAEHTGGAISAEGDRWRLEGSLFSGNTSSNPWGLSQTCTASLRGGRTLQWPPPEGEQDPPCTADALIADPLLGDLGDHGGPTATIPLLEGSPAIDAGESCPPSDQRGEPRAGPCDLGAFERQ